jgi:hypothetical protein
VAITLTYTAPARIIAGDSIDFLVSVPGDYAGWTGSSRLTGPAMMDGTVTTQDSGDFRVTFKGQGSGPKTASLPGGQYQLTVWATSADDRATIYQAPITLDPDLAAGTPALRHAVAMLAMVEKAIQARVGGNGDGGIEEYSIEGTSVRKLSIDQLERLRARYSAEVSRLQNPGQPVRTVSVAFLATGGVMDPRRRYR